MGKCVISKQVRVSHLFALLIYVASVSALAQFPLQGPQRPSLPLAATSASYSLVAAKSGAFLYEYSSTLQQLALSTAFSSDLQGKIVSLVETPFSSAVLDDGRLVVWPYNPSLSGPKNLTRPGTTIFSQFDAVGFFSVTPLSPTTGQYVSRRDGGVVRLVPSPNYAYDPSVTALPWTSNASGVHEIFGLYTLPNYNTNEYSDRLLVHCRDGSLSIRKSDGTVFDGVPSVPENLATGIVQVIHYGAVIVVLKADGSLGAFSYRQLNGWDQEAYVSPLTFSGIDSSVRFNRIERTTSSPGIVAYSDGGIFGIPLMNFGSDQTSLSVRLLELDVTTTAKVLLADLNESGDRGRILRRTGEVFEWSSGQYSQLTPLFVNCIDIGATPQTGMYGGKFYKVAVGGANYLDFTYGKTIPVTDFMTVNVGGSGTSFLSTDLAPALGLSLPILARAVSQEILRHEDNYGLASKPDLLSAVEDAVTRTQSQIQASPNAYNLFSAEQYAANYNNGIAAGTSLVTANPSSYNLYTSNSIMDLRMNGLMVQKQGSNAVVTFQTQTTTDLTQPFTNNGTPITNQVPMPGNKGFIRINAEPAASPNPN